jgi:hypothetical protein
MQVVVSEVKSSGLDRFVEAFPGVLPHSIHGGVHAR